ncbi:hypothetical protein FHR90_003082 [Endobacter medicaginis]|uniref:Uncharacterized protein n=1 Tax=Endobacter medicaginis TaxID=1181271 RepID=A0A850NJ74_9PROT|nr:hypothetical protein [Endobacter medicaginis]MBB3175228.1 hypothetical protein [Endobacter medicaginis]MCX5476288.1 hypothetical protein [Endobacter medicaginis]NVN28954.1 hypothetical protein [Endobacter medicaginis]
MTLEGLTAAAGLVAVAGLTGVLSLRLLFLRRAQEWAAHNGYSLQGDVTLGYFRKLFFDRKRERFSVWQPIREPFELAYADLTSDEWRPVTRDAGRWTIMTRNPLRPIQTFPIGLSAGPRITAAMLANIPGYQRLR